MRKFDPFGLYKQKSVSGYSSAIPILKFTAIYTGTCLNIVYDNAQWVDSQLYLQLIDKYYEGEV